MAGTEDITPKRTFLVLHDYGMGGLWWWVHARSAREVLETFAWVEVITDPETLAGYRDEGLEEVDIEASRMPPGLDGLHVERAAQRGLANFGALADRDIVHLRLRDDDGEPVDQLVEVGPDGRRFRQVEVAEDGTAVRSTPTTGCSTRRSWISSSRHSWTGRSAGATSRNSGQGPARRAPTTGWSSPMCSVIEGDQRPRDRLACLQKNRECEAQYPYPAQSASSDRFTVGRDMPLGTGVESTTRRNVKRRHSGSPLFRSLVRPDRRQGRRPGTRGSTASTSIAAVPG